MIDSIRHHVSKLSRVAPFRRSARPPRRVRLGFYGYRHRTPLTRSAVIARGAVAAALAIATIAAASGQFSR